MDAQFARVLVQKGIIRQGTVIEAYESAKGISCHCDSHKLTEFVVRRATASGDFVYFDAISGREDHPRLIRNDYVATVDGMDVDRLVASHGLSADGKAINGTPRAKYRRRAWTKYKHDQKPQSVADHVEGNQPDR